MELATLLENIKREADRLQREGLNVDVAYDRAITEIVKLAAEQQAVSPFEQCILKAIHDRNGHPVSTTALAVMLGIESRYTMYNYLSDLERRGLVHRPLGPRSKSGWALASEARSQQLNT